MLNLDEFKLYMQQYVESLDAHPVIKEAMCYSLISDGKMIRPLVFFRLLEQSNLRCSDFYNVACAIEMIHTYSLIHDDLPAMDNDDYRRGKLTSHKVYGEDIAILAGDGLLTHSFEVLLNCDLTPAKKNELISVFVKAAGVNQGMINGQVLDIKAFNPDLEYLKKLHLQKTGMMIKLCFDAYLIVANINEGDKYIKLAKNVGVLYQIVDDYLDMYGENIGKKIGSDVENGKVTFVDFYTKEQLEENINELNLENINLCRDLGLSNDFIELIELIGKRNK